MVVVGGVGAGVWRRVCAVGQVGLIVSSARRISSEAVIFRHWAIFPISAPVKGVCPLSLAESVARRYFISSASAPIVFFWRASSACISLERAISNPLNRLRFSLLMTPMMNRLRFSVKS